MRLILAAVLIICTLYQPLPACINDSATQADEQQFASGYGDNDKQRKRTPPTDRFHPGMLILVIPSLTMLGIGFFWLRQERLLVAKRQQRMLRQSEE